MSSNHIVTQIMLIRLRSSFKGQPFVDIELHDVALEDDLCYTLEIGPQTTPVTKMVVKKTETNEVHYTQIYSNVDSKTYWHFDVYVYAEITLERPAEEFQKYWISECQIRAKEELREQNQMIKGMHKGIESMEE